MDGLLGRIPTPSHAASASEAALPTSASRIRYRARRGVAPQSRHVSSEPFQIWRISCSQHHRDVAGVLSDRVRAHNGPGSVGVL
jgi:hypothetical protein